MQLIRAAVLIEIGSWLKNDFVPNIAHNIFFTRIERMMKITSVSIGKLQIPLIRPFITAVRRTEHVDDVVVMLHTDCGKTGYGSAASTPAITGDSQESIIAAIQNILAPILIGKDISEFNSLLELCNNALQKNTSAKAAIDIALHDLFAQDCGLPLYKMLGGSHNKISSCITVSVKDIPDMVADALAFVHAGFKVIKIKVGLNPADDIARVKEIRHALGNKVTLLVDANQGWECKDALSVIRTLEQDGLNIGLVEQPVKADDLNSLKYIRDNVETLIVADESCFSAQDALAIATNQMSDGINIKLMKSGGIEQAKAIYNIAQAAHIRVMVGCMLESPIGVAAIASFALSKPDILYADLDPIALIRDNYVLGGAQRAGNEIILSNKPGLGIEGFRQGFIPVCEIK